MENTSRTSCGVKFFIRSWHKEKFVIQELPNRNRRLRFCIRCGQSNIRSRWRSAYAAAAILYPQPKPKLKIRNSRCHVKKDPRIFKKFYDVYFRCAGWNSSVRGGQKREIVSFFLSPWNDATMCDPGGIRKYVVPRTKPSNNTIRAAL